MKMNKTMRINKNIPFIIISLFLSISINSYGYDFKVGGIYYNIVSSTNKTVEVTHNHDGSIGDLTYYGKIVIPSTVSYSGVTYSVKYIGSWAFNYCSELTEVTIPNSVSDIGHAAFSGCNSLTSVNIPNSVTSIDTRAFGHCTNLTSVTIPNSVTSISSDAFIGCSGLRNIKVAEGNCEYDSRENCNAIIETKSNTLISGCKKTVIPNSVNSIGMYAFSACTGLTEITIPNSVTSISSEAFSYCTGLTEITIPNSVTSISSEAFSYCTGLTSIEVDVDNSVYDSRDNCNAIIETESNTLISGCKNTDIPNSVNSIGMSSFEGCSGLTWVNIPNSVTSIGSHAFMGCSGLTSVYIPNSVTSIGRGAFFDCSGLKLVYIPNSVTSIGSEAFSYCTGLTSVRISNLEAWCKIGFGNISSNPLVYAHNLYLNNELITDLEIPSTITEIKPYSFRSCTSLTSVTIPNSVTSIGSEAFKDCTKLYQVINLSKLSLTKGSTNHGYVAYYAHEVINDGIIDGDFVWQISENENKLISYLGNAHDVNLPSDFNGKNYIIGNYAFSGHNNIVEVTIPNSVTSIGDGAFYGCSGLTSLTIGTGVISIGTNAFSYYENNKYSNLDIKKVIWLTNTPPEGYKNVGSKAHYVSNNLYTGLSNVTIYPYLSSIFEVDGIKYVPVSPSERTCDAIDCTYDPTISNFNIGNTVSFKGVEMTLQNINPYTCYNNDYITDCKINFTGNVGSSAFYDCNAMTNVEIETETIGTEAFNGCNKVETITLSENLTSIGASAFQNCSSLKGVVIPDAVTLLGSSAFSGCSSLASVEIGSGISSIKEKTFYDCSSLTAITIPANVTSIGNNVFANCSSLEELIITDRETELSFGSNGSSPLFSDCPLKTVYIGGNITYPTSSGNGYSPFYSNKSLKNVILKNETNLTDYEFAGCKGLESIDFGNSINQFGSYVFYNCSSLEEVIIPNTVSAIGASAFEGCSSLASVKIGSGISALNDNTFYGCTSLPAITIPANVTSIGNYVFDNCTSLANVTIEDSEIIEEETQNQQSFPNWTSSNHNNNSTSSEEYNINVNPGDVLTFNYTVSSESNYDFLIVKLDGKEILKESGSKSGNYTTTFDSTKVVALYMKYTKDSSNSNGTDNASVTDIMIIGSSAEGSLVLGSNGSNPLFSDCPLNTVYIGRDISYSTSSGKGYSPFYRNTSLETVVITDKETEISENEFYGCIALKTVSMGDGVETIGNWAFSGCSSLDSFSFGSGMKTIGTEAFSDCTAMTKLYSKAIVPPICGSQALDDINKWNCELYVPQASIADYQAAAQWKEFFFIKDIESGVEEVFVDGEDYSNAPIEIYNLSGLKVGDSTENLAPGVYIKRQGRKVEKIAIQ